MHAAHDLLQIDLDALSCLADESMPEWVRPSLGAAPWVVVRRALPVDGRIPVGVRGRTRDQRFAAWLAVSGIRQRVTPGDIARDASAVEPARRVEIPAIAAFAELRTMMANAPYVWGPGGSVGFELATGQHTATKNSDLDIIIQAPLRMNRRWAADLLDDLSDMPARVDVSLEVPGGAIALAGYAKGGRMVLKTCEGPRLVDDPWSIATWARTDGAKS